MKVNDSGEIYRCSGKNVKGSDHEEVSVEVVPRNPIIHRRPQVTIDNFNPEGVVVQENEDFILNCHAKEDSVVFVWSKLDDLHNQTICEKNECIITHFHDEDEGEYQCKGYNIYGESYARIKLRLPNESDLIYEK